VFVHLHAHSHFSFLDALASPEELAQAAARWQMPALALVERWGLSGAVQFYLACREAGVKAILGLELDVHHPQGTGALALLAMDAAGWSNLCQLSSALQMDAERKPENGLAWEKLAQHTQGLLCLSGGVRGLAAGLLRAGQGDAAAAYLDGLADLFPERLYAEIQLQSAADRGWVNGLVHLARKLKVPLLASCAVHYMEPEQAPLQRTLAAMRLNTTLGRLPPDAAAPPEAYFLPPEEAHRRFADYPEAVHATLQAAERCSFELPVGQAHYPELPLPAGQSAAQVLRSRAFEGAQQRYGELAAPVIERLDHELGVIGERGYAPLFLIMQDILDYARREGVPLSSRGSAASSLVAHCLGITSPDPLAQDLYFERFLNVARATPPDIDTDLCSVRRDKVIRYVYRRFGDERVAMVATINRFRMRSALREVAKAHGLPSAEVSRLVDGLPYRGWGPPWMARSAGPEAFNALRQRYPEARMAQIFDQAGAVLELPRHLSVHPGGVVITPGPLLELIPLQMASKGMVITQFDLESVERLGLIKIDLLGTRGLTVLGDVAEAAWQRRQSGEQAVAVLPGVRLAVSPVSLLDGIPVEDAETSALVRAAQTVGCFQIESPGMRMTLREVDARTPQDILVALALYRPGPLTGGLKEAFIRRHLGKEPVEHLHPALGPLLQETYGVILYQEQVLRILSQLAGLSLADADLMRRAMSHFDPGERMKTLRQRFVEGAQQRSGVPAHTGEQIWELMAAFAGYGFPKAHAASYARVAWQSAWCKAHFPGEFIAAVLANWGGYYGQRVYMSEARRLGLRLRPPHVNYARPEFCLAHPEGAATLFVGLNQVRGLTRRSIRRIVSERPFHSMSDFLTRVDPRPAEAESLARVGALAGFGAIPELLDQINQGAWRYAQPPLFELPGQDSANDWSLAERVAAQEELLGVPVEAHPLELLPARLVASANCLTTAQALERRGQVVRVLGIRQTLQRFFNQDGRPFYRLELEDMAGVFVVLVPDEMYRRSRSLLSTRRPLVVEGKVVEGERFEEVVLLAQRISDLAADL
jgi:DNA polymerase-3 subunit alpha